MTMTKLTEPIVIVTRMTGDVNEFNDYFGNNDKLAVVYGSNGFEKIGTGKQLEFKDQIKVVYVNGMLREAIESLCNFLQCAIKSRRILLLIHPGANSDIDSAKEIISCMEHDPKNDEENGKKTKAIDLTKAIINDYTSGTEIFEKVGKLANSIIAESNSSKSEEIDILIADIRKYILKNPVLSVLSLLHLFLPLDIDMQALEILNKDDKSKAIKYLGEMLKDAEKKYVEKFDESQKIRGDIQDNGLKEKSGDKKLLGKDKNESVLYGFLECLDNLRDKTKHSEISEKDIEEALEYFKKKADYESFHDWYCALASCLRGEEACKQK